MLPNISKYLFQSKAVWLLIVIFSILTFKLFTNWGTAHHPFIMDVNQYYGYLPALFKQHDLTFTVNPNNIWLTPTPIGRGVPMVTYGMSIFYLPFYAIASFFSASNSKGYEPIYAWTIHIGCIIFKYGCPSENHVCFNASFRVPVSIYDRILIRRWGMHAIYGC